MSDINLMDLEGDMGKDIIMNIIDEIGGDFKPVIAKFINKLIGEFDKDKIYFVYSQDDKFYQVSVDSDAAEIDIKDVNKQKTTEITQFINIAKEITKSLENEK